jgi:hypothetical protein
MTYVINLIGGSGIGKSTVAAELYVALKKRKLKVELVREVAKDWAWANRTIEAFDQLAITGEQMNKESLLFGKVDYIITDSPVILSGFYFEHNHNQTFMNKAICDYYDFSSGCGVYFDNYVLNRTNEFDQNGRFETEEEALFIDKKIIEYLDNNGYVYTVTTCDSVDEITQSILWDIFRD